MRVADNRGLFCAAFKVGGCLLVTPTSMAEDALLIRRYLEGSQDAFAELVRRHIDAIYATALRRLAGDAHLAEDVTQKVFVNLARKAASLANRPSVLGWLYVSAQFETSKMIRSEQRWRNREQKAQDMNILDEAARPEPDWTVICPLLDQTMGELKEVDRDALLLRFFEAKTLAQVGAILGLTENAARMRVDRALDKLREKLGRHGIKSTAAALSGVLSAQVITAAPAALTATVTTTALAGVSAGGSAVIFMGMTKLQLGIACAIVLGGGTMLWQERQEAARVHSEIAALDADGKVSEIARLKIENSRLATEARQVAALRLEVAEGLALRDTLDGLERKEKEFLAAVEKNKAERADKMPIAELDVWPKPVPGNQGPLYPREMRLMGIHGLTIVSMTVGPDGKPRDFKVKQSTNEAFTAAAMEALKQWNFTPGQKDGRPVSTLVTIPLHFRPDGGEQADWF